jgi:hypothetical protein
MGELKMKSRKDDGMVAIWGAITFLFLVGAVAFAADTSNFFQSARVDQTTADLACLAGAQELPSRPAALNIASENVKANFPRVAPATPVMATDQATLTVGGNAVVINTNWGGDSDKIRVRVTSSEGRTFSRIWGSAPVQVVQEAFCTATPGQIGGGTLPFAAGTLGYQGGLQDCGNKVLNPGNCGQILVTHDGINGNNNILEENIAVGLDRLLEPWLGPPGSGYATCPSVASGGTCHQMETDPGTGGKVGAGFQRRLANTAGSSCTFFFNGRNLDCDSPTQILGASPTALMSQFPSRPAWWEETLYGTYNAANTTNHYWYNQSVAKCDSPRIGSVPIASGNLNWDIGDTFTGWNGRKDVKVVGIYEVIIVEPNDGGDFQGASGNNLKNANGYVMWYGPNAVCSDGRPIGQLNGVPPGSGELEVKLVAS